MPLVNGVRPSIEHNQEAITVEKPSSRENGNNVDKKSNFLILCQIGVMIGFEKGLKYITLFFHIFWS